MKKTKKKKSFGRKIMMKTKKEMLILLLHQIWKCTLSTPADLENQDYESDIGFPVHILIHAVFIIQCIIAAFGLCDNLQVLVPLKIQIIG